MVDPNGSPDGEYVSENAKEFSKWVSDGKQAQQALTALRQEAVGCQRCELRKSCLQVIFGDEHHYSKLMIVSSHPHPYDGNQHALFPKEEAMLLYQTLDSIGAIHLFPQPTYGPLTYGFISNGGIYFTTAVKCAVSGRHPTSENIRACLPWLGQQIGIIKPRVIVAMGNAALHALTGIPLAKCRVTRERGSLFLARDKKTLLMATHDPGFVLHWEDTHKNKTGQARQELKADLATAWGAVCRG